MKVTYSMLVAVLFHTLGADFAAMSDDVESATTLGACPAQGDPSCVEDTTSLMQMTANVKSRRLGAEEERRVLDGHGPVTFSGMCERLNFNGHEQKLAAEILWDHLANHDVALLAEVKEPTENVQVDSIKAATLGILRISKKPEEGEGEKKEGEEGEGENHEAEEGEGEKKGGEEGGEKEGEEKEGGEEEEKLDPEFFKITKPIAGNFIILDPHMAIAVSLLFLMTFQMMLVYVTAWPEIKIRYYAWGLISATISIFVAVLLFSAVNTYFNESLFPTSDLIQQGVINTVQVLIYYLTLQCIVMVTTGAWQYIFFDQVGFVEPGSESVSFFNCGSWFSAQTSGTDYYDGKDLPMSILEQKTAIRRRTRCWCLLFAHATGFASLNAGGCFMHYFTTPMYAYCVAFIYAFFMIFVFWAFQNWRVGHLEEASKYHELPAPRTRSQRNGGQVREEKGVFSDDATVSEAMAGGRAWSMHLYDEEVFDAEEDIVGVATSFLLVQALRYNFSGHLPNNFGVEEEKEDYEHNVYETYALIGCSFLFLIALYAVIVAKDNLKASFTKDKGSKGRLLKRIFGSFQKAFSMGFAWCWLYATMYREAKVLPEEAPFTITERVILAFTLSMVAFGVIFIVDAVQKLKSMQGERPQEFMYEVIMCLSILVGFSWEQCFDRAVEVVAMVCHQRWHMNPETTQIGTAVLIVSICVLPWRRVILKTAMEYEEECGPAEEEEEEEEASEAK